MAIAIDETETMPTADENQQEENKNNTLEKSRVLFLYFCLRRVAPSTKVACSLTTLNYSPTERDSRFCEAWSQFDFIDLLNSHIQY